MCKINRIPKVGKVSQRPIPVSLPSFNPVREGITFSFEALDKNEFFNLDGTCPNWSSDLFDMLKEVSTHSERDLISGKFRTYRVHNHEKATCPCAIPEGVELRDCYQIRISKSKGGIHGVFRENVFYVIWLDPLHNMYPDEHYGGLRKVKIPSTCCKDRDEEIAHLKQELDEARHCAEEWKELAEASLDEQK